MLIETSNITKALRQPTTYFQTFRDDYSYDWLKLPKHKYEYEVHYVLFPTVGEPIELNISRSLCMSFVFGCLEEVDKEAYLSEFNESLNEFTYYEQDDDLYFPIVNIDDLNGILECKKQDENLYYMRLIDEDHKKIYRLGTITKDIIFELANYLDEVVEGFMNYASDDFDNFPEYSVMLMNKYHFDEATKSVFVGLNNEYQILEKELAEVEELDEAISTNSMTEQEAKEEYESFLTQWNVDRILDAAAKDLKVSKEAMIEASMKARESDESEVDYSTTDMESSKED